MEHIRQHLPEQKLPPKKVLPLGKRSAPTERGELMEYFLGKLNHARVQDGLPPMTMGRMGRLLMAIPTKDLYYLKTVCDQAPNFSKKFWWEVNPKKHEGPPIGVQSRPAAPTTKKPN